MRYVYCVLIPLLLQITTVYVIGVMNTGNGSWLGLGAFLFAIPVIPITAIINTTRTRAHANKKTIVLFLHGLLVAFLVPLIIIILFSLAVLVEGLVGRYL